MTLEKRNHTYGTLAMSGSDLHEKIPDVKWIHNGERPGIGKRARGPLFVKGMRIIVVAELSKLCPRGFLFMPKILSAILGCCLQGALKVYFHQNRKALLAP